jgi:hypothetical protein
MRWTLLAAGSLLSLASCASVEFYAPEVGAGWTKTPVVVNGGTASVEGVSVQKTGEDYTPVKSVGNLLAEAYQGARRETWSVTGPGGYQAQVEILQTGLVFAGPVTKNVLAADSIDFTKAQSLVRVTQGSQSQTSENAGVTSAVEAVLGDRSVTAHYQGQSSGQVKDYKGWGMTTGYRLVSAGKLWGYLSILGPWALDRAPGTADDALVLGLSLVAASQHFSPQIPPLKVQADVVDFFGLKLTTEVTHN